MAGIYVPGRGPINAKIMFVGESPGEVEERTKMPFSGPGGKEFERMLSDAGLRRDACWLTNVSKYRVPSVKDPKITFHQRCQMAHVSFDQQVDELRKEIQQVQPNMIVALGRTALWTLTGKTNLDDWRGSLLMTWLGRKMLATYNPAQFLHNDDRVIAEYWKREVGVADFRRARVEASAPELRRPSRLLTIARSSADLYAFLQENREHTTLAIDIEAEECIPTCVGLAFTPHLGLTVPLWTGVSDSDRAATWQLLAQVLRDPRFLKVGQNFKYDADKLMRLGLPIDRLHSDTMLKAFCINPELPVNLSFLTSLYTLEPYYKHEGMYEGSEEDLFVGCARDACVTREVDHALQSDLDEMGLSEYYHQFVMPLHELYLQIENEGFTINEAVRTELLRKYIEMDERLRLQLYTDTQQYLNVNSWPQVSKLLYTDLQIPTRKGTGEEVLATLLTNVVKDPLRTRVCESILDARRVRKATGHYLTALPDYDGKVRTTYYLCLNTGRSSTGQQDPPVRPSVELSESGDDGKTKTRKKALGAAFQVLTKHGDIGPDARRMYEPGEGYVFLQADLSQAEARVVFLLANDDEALRDLDAHDYHALTASWFFGGSEDDHRKRDGREPPTRFAGKTLRHAGHYGASKKRAALEVNTQARKFHIDLRITEKMAAEALDIFHRRQPKIRNVFQAEIVACLERDRMLRAPVPYGIDATVGGTRIFFERWGEDLNRQAYAYLPQRAVAEHTKAAGLRLQGLAPWIRPVVEAHDALLFRVPAERLGEAAHLVAAEFERPLDFRHCSLPRGLLRIPCELESGPNYYELRKYVPLAADGARRPALV